MPKQIALSYRFHLEKQAPTAAKAIESYVEGIQDRMTDLVEGKGVRTNNGTLLCIPEDKFGVILDGIHTMRCYNDVLAYIVDNSELERDSEDYAWFKAQCCILRARMHFVESRVTRGLRLKAARECRMPEGAGYASFILKTIGLYDGDRHLAACIAELEQALKMSLTQTVGDSSQNFMQQRQRILILLAEACFTSGDVRGFRRYVSLGSCIKTDSVTLNAVQYRSTISAVVLQSLLDSTELHEAEELVTSANWWNSDEIFFMHLIILKREGKLTREKAIPILEKIQRIKTTKGILSTPKGLQFLESFLLPELVFRIELIDVVYNVLFTNNSPMKFNNEIISKELNTVIQLACLTFRSKMTCVNRGCSKKAMLTCNRCMRSICTVECKYPDHNCSPIVSIISTASYARGRDE